MLFCQLVIKILSKKEIKAYIKGHNSGTNVPKMMCNNPNEDLVNINAYIKFVKLMTICSQDIERKRNLGQIKDHYSSTNVRNKSCDNPNIDLVNINA